MIARPVPQVRAQGEPFAPRHAALRGSVRDWVARHVTPHVEEWESAREFPRSLYRQAGEAGLFGWKYGPEDGGLGPDLLADAVVTEELACCGSGGVAAGLGATKDLAPYYVAKFGTSEQRRRWLLPAVSGTAVAALGVTEPGAGSDVAGVRCRAERDGDSWVLSGSKSFITNGCRADWVLVAARTSETPGWRGVSLLVVPTDTAGFAADRIHTLGWGTSQTGLLHLSGVRVGTDALLGAEGDGFVMIMKSFQWERICLALGAVSGAAEGLDRCASWGVDDRWWELARRVAAVRALTYESLHDTVAGRDVVPAVSAAKWLACDLSVEVASYRLARAQHKGPGEIDAADRSLRDARLGPIGGGAREVMAELVSRALPLR